MPQTKTSQINAQRARQRAADLIRLGKQMEAAQGKQTAPKARQKVPEPIFDEAELSSSSSESEQEEVPEPVPQPPPAPQRKPRQEKKKKYDEIDTKLGDLSKSLLLLQEQMVKQAAQPPPPPPQPTVRPMPSIQDLARSVPFIKF